MKLIRFLYNLIYKAFTSDLSARKSKVVLGEAENGIVKCEIQESVIDSIEIGDGIDREPVTGEGKYNKTKYIRKEPTGYYGILPRACNQKINKRSGVYSITNLINGHRYIGSSVRLSKRMTDHRCSLRDGIHKNTHLQNAFIKYGFNNFKFEILEFCERDNCIEREQFHIDSYDFETLYNVSKYAENCLGVPGTRKVGEFSHSEETKIKMSKNSARLSPPNKGVGTRSFELVYNNVLYKGVGIYLFCDEMGLNATTIYNVLNKTRGITQSGGFRLPKENDVYTNIIEWKPNCGIERPVYIEVFEFVNKNNTLYRVIDLHTFCKEFNLISNCMKRIGKPKQSNHKGWTKPQKDIEYSQVINWDNQKQESK